MTLMNASSNRSNHNRSAKAIRETKKGHNLTVNRITPDSPSAGMHDLVLTRMDTPKYGETLKFMYIRYQPILVVLPKVYQV